MSEVSAIDKLANCVLQKQLEIRVFENNSDLAEYSLRRLGIKSQLIDNSEMTEIVIYDEYADADINSPVLWLHLILSSCESIEETDSYQQWLKDEGYPDIDFFRSLHAQHLAVVPVIRETVGSDVKAIPYFEIEMNTAVAQYLRKIELK